MPFSFQYHDPSSRHPDFLFHHPIRAFYIGDAIKGFAFGMYAIFLPVYLLTIFRDAEFTHPIVWIFIYYAALDGLTAMGMYVTPRFLPRFGFRKFVGVAFIAVAIHLVLLVQAESMPLFLIPALLAAVMYRALFWPGYHILFARLTSKGHRGEAVGKRAAFMKLARVVSPALGGVLIANFGFAPVLWIVVGLVLLSSVAYLTADMHDGHRGGPAPILREIHKRGGVRAAIAISSMGMLLALATVVWPLYLFSLHIGFEALGYITTAASLFTVVALFLFGKYTDRKSHGQLLKVTAPLYAGAWSFRIAAQGIFSAFSADSLAGFTGSLMSVPFDAHLYERMQNSDANEQVHIIIFRELASNGGKAILAALIAVYLFLGGPLRWLMLIAIPLSLTIPLISKWPHKDSDGEQPLL